MSTYGIKTPRLLQADAYTVGSGTHVSKEAKQFSAYQMVARQVPEWMPEHFADFPVEPRFVLFGVGMVLHDLLSTPITHAEIDETLKFLKTFHAGGTEFTVDEQLWRRVVDEHNGIPPIVIEGFRDGATFFVGEPILQITAADGFGELAGYFESKLLQVWATSELTTLMRHWLDYNKALVKECTSGYLTEDALNFLAALQTHDFGDRASTCPQESERLGLAYLASGHFGTDTTSAAYIAWKLSGEKAIGSSIKALAHRIVQGFTEEGNAYKALFESAPNAYTSHVGDTNDFFRAVDMYLVPLAKLAAQQGGVIVDRPDSGDHTGQLKYVFEAGRDADMSVVVHKDKNLLGMTSLKSIEGNSMDFKTIIKCNRELINSGWAPPYCGIYGIGGFKRNVIKRDNFGMTLKLCAVGEDKREVMKFSHTPGKMSVPGLVKVVREVGKSTVRALNEAGDSEYIIWFDGRKGKVFENTESFVDIRNRVLKDFHKFPLPSEVLSLRIRELRKQIRHKYVAK